MVSSTTYKGATARMSGISLVLLAFFSTLHPSRCNPDYSYSQTSRFPDSGWSGSCNSGHKQSPIDILKDTVWQNTNKSVDFYNYDKLVSANITNDGHSINLKVNESDGVRLMIDKTEYWLHSFHFHVGCTEHAFNHKRYDLELHLVHYNRQIGEFIPVKESSNQGLSVVGVLFEQSGNTENEALNVLLDMIRTNSTRRSIDKKSLTYRQLLPQKLDHVYQYPGSLTTPPCYETVLWNVINQTNLISVRQIREFRRFHRDPIPNCRPPQHLNNRIIRYAGVKEVSDGSSMLQSLTKTCYIVMFGLIYYLSSAFSSQY